MHGRPLPSYHAHELVYRHMKSANVTHWNQCIGLPVIEPGNIRFLEDVLEQPWFPQVGRAVEFGCGSAPMLRWITKKLGCQGVGVDVSRTAIDIAKRLTPAGAPLAFRQSDVIRLPKKDEGRYDLVIDGQCLHCITDPADRVAYWKSAHRVLKPDGCIVVFTMASPLRRQEFRMRHGKLRNNVTYHPHNDAANYRGSVSCGDGYEVPVRMFEHWQSILRSMKSHGLVPMLYRLNRCCKADPLSYISIAGLCRK